MEVSIEYMFRKWDRTWSSSKYHEAFLATSGKISCILLLAETVTLLWATISSTFCFQAIIFALSSDTRNCCFFLSSARRSRFSCSRALTASVWSSNSVLIRLLWRSTSCSLFFRDVSLCRTRERSFSICNNDQIRLLLILQRFLRFRFLSAFLVFLFGTSPP